MICLDPDTEIIELVLWAYQRGCEDSIQILKNTAPDMDILREAFRKILKEKFKK